MRIIDWSIVLALAAILATSGCATPGSRGGVSQEQAGMVIGGALGGLLGAQVGDQEDEGRTAAIILGTLAGAAIGGAVGRSMDDVDRLKTGHALENVRTGVSSRWRNPDTGNRYAVTPTRTYDRPSRPCREYEIEAMIEGRTETVRGTACREPDGTWRTEN